MFDPTLLATTTVPEGSVPVTPDVVTAIGVPTEAGRNLSPGRTSEDGRERGDKEAFHMMIP